MARVLDRSLGYTTIREIHERHNDLYSYEVETQRTFVWDSERMNLLIDSIFHNYSINTTYVNRRNGKKRVIDGQNRIKTFVSFVNGEWKLNENFIFQVKDDEGEVIEEHDFSNMGFLDLPKEYQDKIKNYNVVSEEFFDLTDDEENEHCYRLNRGKSLNVISETRMMARGDIQRFVAKLGKTSFFDRKVNITETAKKGFIHEAVIYNILLFETGLQNEVATKNMQKFVQRVKDEELLTEEIQMTILKTITFLDEAFPSKDKFLVAKNILPVYLLGKTAIKDNMKPRDFVDMIENFAFEENSEYEKNKKKSHLSTTILMKQFSILKKHYNKYKEAIKLSSQENKENITAEVE